jgi:hypothetical protein
MLNSIPCILLIEQRHLGTNCANIRIPVGLYLNLVSGVDLGGNHSEGLANLQND